MKVREYTEIVTVKTIMCPVCEADMISYENKKHKCVRCGMRGLFKKQERKTDYIVTGEKDETV
jgi:tRNA(Ile2) C34 agmatinyltransferase TiaS